MRLNYFIHMGIKNGKMRQNRIVSVFFGRYLWFDKRALKNVSFFWLINGLLQKHLFDLSDTALQTQTHSRTTPNRSNCKQKQT